MKRILVVVVMCLSVAVLGGCGSGGTASGGASGAAYHTITAEQAKATMDSGDPYTLVDVRTQAEYDAGHIAHAILIPVDQIASRAATDLPDKNALIYVYCRSGVRATTAAHAIVDLGYTKVYNLGGIQSWPYGTVTS